MNHDETTRPQPAIAESTTESASATADPEQVLTDPAPERHAAAIRPTGRAAAWRERTFGLRSAIALAAAGLVLGGVAGTAIGFVLDDGDAPAHHGTPFEDSHPPRERGPLPGIPPTTEPETSSLNS